MSPEHKRRLSAVWFADIVGYTELSSRDEDGALALVDELQRLTREAVEPLGGRIVKFVGDGALSVFESADSALKSALSLQESFSNSAIVQEKDCTLRIGLHIGDVTEAADGDVYGDGVNVASRVEGMAEPGQVVLSEDAYRLVRQRGEHSFRPVGPVRMKGVEEPMWLYVVGAPQPSTAVVREASTAVYDAITRHWPKLALAGVGVAGAAALAFDRVANWSTESYVFAWATTTAGIWFLFDKAESAMSARSKKQVVSWLREADLRSGLESIPTQFAALFDWVFGTKHFTWRCVGRSAMASLLAALLVAALMLATGGLNIIPNRQAFVVVGAAGALAIVLAGRIGGPTAVRWADSLSRTLPGPAAAANMGRYALRGLFSASVVLLTVGLVVTGIMFLPLGDVGGALIGTALLLLVLNLSADYLSLLETRWALRWIKRTSHLAPVLVVDLALTCAIWGLWFAFVFTLPPIRADFGDMVSIVARPGTEDDSFMAVAFVTSFLTTFSTSLWLWLHILSAIAARVLLRLNRGVGFLLRVTDVERQPFRAMGFVSVIVATGIFAVGVPVVVGLPGAASESASRSGQSCSGRPDAALATFEDPSLTTAVVRTVGRASAFGWLIGTRRPRDLTCGSVAGLGALVARSASIASLTGIENLTGLRILDLDGNSLSDISVLRDLRRLTVLILRNNQLSDISMLSNLTGLRALDLGGNSINDISALSGLTNLTSLDLRSTGLTDLSALRALTGLVELRLNDNSITDISPVAGITGLRTVWLSSNPIEDLSPLSGLARLTFLDLSGDSITDVSALSGLTGLTMLDLNDNSITDIEPLRRLTGLSHLILNNNSITDVNVLREFPDLSTLGLAGNSITDIAALQGLRRLGSEPTGSFPDVDLSRNRRLRDIQPLIDNTALEPARGLRHQLDLSSTNVSCRDIARLEAKGLTVRSDCE